MACLGPCSAFRNRSLISEWHLYFCTASLPPSFPSHISSHQSMRCSPTCHPHSAVPFNFKIRPSKHTATTHTHTYTCAVHLPFAQRAPPQSVRFRSSQAACGCCSSSTEHDALTSPARQPNPPLTMAICMLNCATKPIYKLTFCPRRSAAALARRAPSASQPVPGLNIPRARASAGLIEYELHTKGLRLGARARSQTRVYNIANSISQRRWRRRRTLESSFSGNVRESRRCDKMEFVCTHIFHYNSCLHTNKPYHHHTNSTTGNYVASKTS